MAARASEAEAERDAAVEEAAQAIFYLQRVRKELEVLKRSDQQNQQHPCCCSCSSVERSEGDQLQQLCRQQLANNGVNNTERHDQILWQVGQIAETIWNTVHATQGSGDEGGQSSITAPLVPQTLTDIKIVVLEQFQTLVPNDEMHLYEEVHALYTDVARYEKLQESMAQRMKTLLDKNDELEMRLQSLKALLLDEDSEDRQCALVTPLEEARDLSLKHKVDELQQQLDERESQIKQLPNMVEMQAAVILTEPVGSHESSDVQELRYTSELVSRSCYNDEYDEFEVPIDDFLNQKPSTISEVYKTFSGCDIHPSIAGLEEEISLQDTSSSESSEAIGILQAQLEMYIRCLHRRARSKQ